MNDRQIAYMRQIRDGLFSLKQWGILADTSDAEALDDLWTGAAQDVLRKLGERGTSIRNRISKFSRKKRMESWHDAIQDRQYKRDLRPFAHRQLKSQVADMTSEFEVQSALERDLDRDDSSKPTSLDTAISTPTSQENALLHPSNHKRAQEQDATSVLEERASQKKKKKKTNKRSAVIPTDTSNSAATASTGTTGSITPTEANVTKHSTSRIIFDASKALPIYLRLEGFDVGKAFKVLQAHAEEIINDGSEKVKVSNVHLFLAGNYIWHTATALPGMSGDFRQSICNSIEVSKVRLSPSEVYLCIDLGRELSDAGRIRSRLAEDGDEHIIQLFQTLANKLSVEAMPWVFKNEDSHAHGVLDVIVTQLFPEGRAPYEMIWANRPSEASKLRRGEPLKPDGTITKEDFEVAYLEVKGPKDDRCQSKYLEDLWNLSSFAKDCIDSNLSARRSVKLVPLVQVFGHKVTLYVMKFVSGLYILHQVATCYLPRDLQDLGGMIQCVETFRTLKHILDDLDMRQYGRTQSRSETEDLLPYDQLPRPTNVSPSSRPFFPRTSLSLTTSIVT
ncbi:hypothetical protein BGW38_001090 [Lunasporangiospora selenospora]|uniref:Uncharacterized protein n=1 Tax=Lunasporangiospora selenospora TaxID=979761 RepID=A0A9P6FUJ9_9FUNG|nr:hypothetical protein BGW38_001090 [Lunasporangiospora selenospora]